MIGIACSTQGVSAIFAGCRFFAGKRAPTYMRYATSRRSRLAGERVGSCTLAVADPSRSPASRLLRIWFLPEATTGTAGMWGASSWTAWLVGPLSRSDVARAAKALPGRASTPRAGPTECTRFHCRSRLAGERVGSDAAKAESRSTVVADPAIHKRVPHSARQAMAQERAVLALG